MAAVDESAQYCSILAKLAIRLPQDSPRPKPACYNEFWYILEGHGEISRDNGIECCITVLVPGTAIEILTRTAFQYRNVSDVDLKFICITMPPWPGDSEATYVKGVWQPTI